MKHGRVDAEGHTKRQFDSGSNQDGKYNISELVIRIGWEALQELVTFGLLSLAEYVRQRVDDASNRHLACLTIQYTTNWPAS
jgi:hypothetical protein